MTPAQKLTRRAMKREQEIIATFAAMATAAGMTLMQFAALGILLYADMSTKAVRMTVHSCNPSPDIPAIQDGRHFSAGHRARLVEVWKDPEFFPTMSRASQELVAMLQSPPALRYFWLLCLADAPGERMLSWSVSMIPWETDQDEGLGHGQAS